MNEISDIIVIGGGPVGSFAALILSKLGKKVTVFEEHQEIGRPNHCAGHLSINSLRSLGLYPLPNKIVENEFSSVNFYSYDGFSFSVKLSKPVTCAVNRELFDKHIFNQAQDAGTIFHLNSRVQSLIIQNGFIRGVKVNQDGSNEIYKSKIVFDAEGISSRLLKQTSLVPLNPKKLVYAVNGEVENVKNLQSNGVDVYFGRDYAPGFYAWLIPKTDRTAKIGLANNIGNPNDFLNRFMINHPIASKFLSQAKLIAREFHSIPLGGPIPKLFLNGFMVLGDAASLVKPTTGGGVIFGLRSSIIAAKAANLAIDNNNFSSKFLKFYQLNYMKAFSFDFRVMLKIRSFLNSVSDKNFSKILRFCKRIGLDNSIRNFDEIDLQGRTLFKAMPKPAVCVTLIYFLMMYLQTFYIRPNIH